MNPNMNQNLNNNGMNFINPNPMLFPMPLMMPIGINNQNNQVNNLINNNMMMDEEEIRVKNIVEPYEKKIKELEEIIRQKDFEISVLKNKLFNFNNIQGNNNLLNINMNMNNQMMNMRNINYPNIDDEINIKFIDENNKETLIKFSKFAKTKKLLEKYLNDKNSHSDIREYIFTCNNNKLIPGLILEKNNINDSSTIYVKRKKIFGLMFKYEGRYIPINLDENTSVCMAIIYFLLEIDREDLIVDLMNNKIHFTMIFNAETINVNEIKTIKEYFKQYNAVITVSRIGL